MMPVDVNSVLRAIFIGNRPVHELVGDQARPLGNYTSYEMPLVVWALRGGDTNRSLDGDEEEQNPSVQIDCYGGTFDQAKALYEAVYDCLSSISQLIIAGHLVESVSLDQARDDDEPLIVGQTIPDTLFTLDCRLWLQRIPE